MEETDNGKVVNPHRRKVVQWVTEWPTRSRNLTASNIWPVHLYKNVTCKQNNSVLLLCFVPTRRSQATVTVKRCTHTHTHTYRQTNKLSGEVDPFLQHYHTHSSTYLSPPGLSGSSPSTDRSLAAEAGHVHRQQHNSLTVQHETAINHKNGARPTDDYGRINTCHHSEENLKMLSRTTAMRLEWTSKWVTVKHL